VLDTTEKLYSSNGQLFFDGSPLLTEAQVLDTTEWISENVLVDSLIPNNAGATIVLDNQIKQVNNKYQVRVLLNGLELAENEFEVDVDDNKTITLNLPAQVYPIEAGETFKVWYVKA
jgi:ATP-dependent protease HslVU (ClpYQ) ATPase subunit